MGDCRRQERSPATEPRQPPKSGRGKFKSLSAKLRLDSSFRYVWLPSDISVRTRSSSWLRQLLPPSAERKDQTSSDRRLMLRKDRLRIQEWKLRALSKEWCICPIIPELQAAEHVRG